jgi:hypothetical protein
MTIATTTNDGSDRVRPLIIGMTLGAAELLARVAQYHPADHPAILNLARTEARYQQARRTELYQLVLLQDVRVVLPARLTAVQITALENLGPLAETGYAVHEGEDARNILVAGV